MIVVQYKRSQETLKKKLLSNKSLDKKLKVYKFKRYIE